MNFGPRTDEKESFAIMDRALELGINFFNTANVYGNYEEGYQGLTEEIIGRWFSQGEGRREKVILATKFYNNMNDSLDGPNDEPGVSAYKLYRQLEGSLKRLQTDHVELYQMHHIDHQINWDEIYGALENVISSGKVYYAGSSNFGARHLAYAKATADKRNFIGLVSEQHVYNLIGRLPELELLPAANELGMGILVWSPLASGKLADNLFGRRGRVVCKLSDIERNQLKKYAELCEAIGESESNVALAWLLQNPAVTAPIIGPRTVAQLEQAVESLSIELSAQTLKRLDNIFPAVGSAPEAYAW